MPIFIGFSWVKLIRITSKSVITGVTILGQFFVRFFISLKKLINSFGEKNKTKEKEGREETKIEAVEKVVKK